MDYTFQEIKQIFDTCPIGYYLGSNVVNITLDEKAPTSYYNPARNMIVISYPFIKQQADKLDDYELNIETVIRSFIYHELSHAILTPSVLYDTCMTDKEKSMINIVEDTRIETLMQDYYMNTDFKGLVRCVVDSKKLDLTNPSILQGDDGFWLVVRLGIGTEEMRKDLDYIFQTYKDMSAKMETFAWSDGFFNKTTGQFIPFSRYRNDIVNFYTKYFSSTAKPLSDELLQQLLQQLQDLLLEKDEQNDKSEGEGESVGESEIGKEITSMREQKEGEEQKDEQENGVVYKGKNAIAPLTKEDLKSKIASVLQQGLNPVLMQQLSAIFEKSTVVEKMSAGATNGYSGVLNPRSCVRKDYKFFIHQDNKGNNKGFSKLHLNLFVDISGSFHPNEQSMNNILNCLSRLEKDNPNFSYDLITINDRATLKSPTERWIKCSGGNRLPLYLKELYYKAYKYDSVNYNVILFDGDCLSDCYGETERQELNNFKKLFDIKTTAIISDYANKEYFHDFKNAQVHYCSNYVEEFTKKIVEVLKVAFM